MTALGLTALVAFVPDPPSVSDQLDAYIQEHAQALEVDPVASITAAGEVARDTYAATPGIATLAAGGTNHDWAKLVLLFGGWPMSENNVTVITRWMRQENGPESWWTRNNPLNNGLGSGGGGGLGSYANLVIAAQYAAKNLQKNPGFNQIEADLAASADTAATESAIWASPWASGHYANGGHWHYSPVPAVKAPAGAWG
jgi:hypothetical protein